MKIIWNSFLAAIILSLIGCVSDNKGEYIKNSILGYDSYGNPITFNNMNYENKIVKKYDPYGLSCKAYYAYEDKGKEILHGKCVIWEKGVPESEMTYVEGKLDGLCILRNAENEIISEGICRNNLPWDGRFMIGPESSSALKCIVIKGIVIRSEKQDGAIFTEGSLKDDKEWNGTFINLKEKFKIEKYKDGNLLPPEDIQKKIENLK
jgi:hypothetical protein